MDPSISVPQTWAENSNTNINNSQGSVAIQYSMVDSNSDIFSFIFPKRQIEANNIWDPIKHNFFSLANHLLNIFYQWQEKNSLCVCATGS